MKEELVYTDTGGNKLYVRYIKTRDVWQWTAKNKKGQIVTSAGVRTLMQRALRERSDQWKRQGKHEMVEHLLKLAKRLPRAKKVPQKSGHLIQKVSNR
jgi:hypothetical protein